MTIDPGASGNNQVIVNGTPGNDTIAIEGNSANSVSVTVNSLQAVTINEGHTQSLVIAGGTGNDNATVNSTVTPVTVPITFDGGAGTNAMTLVGGTATAETYTPGAPVGSGTLAVTFALGTESINFLNLAPIFDMIAGPLVVLGHQRFQRHQLFRRFRQPSGLSEQHAVNRLGPGQRR